MAWVMVATAGAALVIVARHRRLYVDALANALVRAVRQKRCTPADAAAHFAAWELLALPRIDTRSLVHRSLISHGCIVNGTVERSVLSPGVRVEVGAVVRDSIVMFDTAIRAGAVVDRAILDKEVSIGPNSVIGEGNDDTPNRRDPRLSTGITLVGKRAVVPRGVRIGRNCRIDENVRATDFPRRIVRSGETISGPHRRSVPVMAATGEATARTSA